MAISVYKLGRLLIAAILITGIIPCTVMAQSTSKLMIQDPVLNKSYLQCASNIAGANYMPGYKSSLGLIGMFQFDVYKAQKAGLCSNPVPRMRKVQVWKFCDFKGPIAKKYDINNQYDFRFDPKATAAQFEMMHNLNAGYDAIIFQNKYDLLFDTYVKAIYITPGVIRALLHNYGGPATAEFLSSGTVKNSRNSTPYTLANCMAQCIAKQGKEWICGSLIKN